MNNRVPNVAPEKCSWCNGTNVHTDFNTIILPRPPHGPDDPCPYLAELHRTTRCLGCGTVESAHSTVSVPATAFIAFDPPIYRSPVTGGSQVALISTFNDPLKR